ncbi:hypothetical protein FB451DRAFT_1478249 [Mycena latifolia]|nr:hypothetical protein FB451DRAFT_1478249 [Mycena latifolia]
MHRALQSPETVEMICSKLTPLETNLVSLMRTARIFQEPALNALWSRQTTFAHILRCMPADLWNRPVIVGSVNCLNVARPITPRDWERPLFYLHRVKSLICSTTDVPSEQLFEILSLCLPADHFFPNLATLSWTWLRPSLFPHVRTLLGPKITRLEIDITFTIPHLTLIATLPLKCPNLTDVAIFSDSIPPDLSAGMHLANNISLCIRAMKRIERLYVKHLDRAAFEYLATVPTLKSLTVLAEFTPPTRPSPPWPLTNILFPSLKQLNLSPRTTQSAIAWFKTMSHSPLAEIDIEFTAPITVSVISALCDTISEQFPRWSLSSLEVHGPRANEDEHLASASPSEYLTKNCVLENLFGFGNLVTVYLVVNGGFDLDNGMILQMARAWPALRSLSLSPTCPTHVVRRVTLAGLCALADHCPHLTSLELEINALVIPAADRAARNRAAHSSAVAGFIFDIFPALSDISAMHEYDLNAVGEPNVDVLTFRRRWKAVEEKLGTRRRCKRYVSGFCVTYLPLILVPTVSV